MANSSVVSTTQVGGKAIRDIENPELVELSRVVDSDGLEGLRSPSARSVGSYSECEYAAQHVRDPESLLRGLLSCGASVEVAARLTSGYYEALAGGSSQNRSVASTTSSRARRTRLWCERVSALSDVPGQCYLRVIRFSRRRAYMEKLGVDPSVQDFLAMLEPGDLHLPTARTVGLYSLPGGRGCQPLYHVADTCDDGEFVGTVYSSIACLLRLYPFVNHNGFECDDDHTIASMPLVGVIGLAAVERAQNVVSTTSGDFVVASESVGLPKSTQLTQLFSLDFTECRCLVHRTPVTKDSSFSGIGCCKRKPGSSAVVRAAFDGTQRYCHAEESVRLQDRKLLELMLSDDDPCVLDGARRSQELARLCTSSATTNSAAFGNGYCYLAALMHDTWWRAARLLGPNPELSAFARALLWLGRPAAKLQTLVKVCDGYYHLTPVKNDKGINQHAGRLLLREIERLLVSEPNARVGVHIDELRAGAAVSECSDSSDVDDWQAVSDDELADYKRGNVVPEFNSGLRYLELFPYQSRTSVVSVLGVSPTIRDLVDQLSVFADTIFARFIFEIRAGDIVMLPDYAVPVSRGEVSPTWFRLRSLCSVVPYHRLVT